MEWGGPIFVLGIIAISTIGWVITTAIRARHGYPIENEWGGSCGKESEATKAVMAENGQLKETVKRLEERLGVLERIATDPARRLSNEIDELQQ